MRRIIPTFLLIASLPVWAQAVDYQREVHGVLAERCIVCHGQEKRSGGLSLATYDDVLNGGRSGAAVKPGNAKDSLLMQRVTGGGAQRMPLGGPPLKEAELAILSRWIEQGARPNPTAAAAKAKWEAPLQLTRPKAPDVIWKDWDGPIDRFTAKYIGGPSAPPVVSDAVFARRAYLDIWGLLPPPEELQKFIDDRDPAKRSQLVKHLLSDSQKYTEHWISYWNDLLRNEEGVNYYSESASRKSITAWLLKALDGNTGYDQWIGKLLNPTAPGDPDGFLIGVNWRGTVSAGQTPAMQAAQNAAQVFLGINLKCNSCHDSFISKWKLKDAWSLAAMFSDEEKLSMYKCDVIQKEMASAGFLYPELNRTPASLSAADRRATAAAVFLDKRNGRVPRTLVNRIWQKLMGRGIVADVDDMEGEPWSPELLDSLASDFVDSGYDLKALIAEILTSKAYQLPSVAQKGDPAKEYVFRGPEWRRISAEQFADAVAQITGDWPVTSRAYPSKPPVSNQAFRITGVPSDGAGIRPRTTSQPDTKPSLATKIAPSHYARAWRIPGSSLDRAMGRPIRDQVYSTRDTQATTLQALELVNGDKLTHWLWRGARRMLGELPPEPESKIAWQLNGLRAVPTEFDIDVSHSDKLYFVVADASSTAADKGAPAWMDLEFTGPSGKVPVSTMNVKFPSMQVVDIKGKGYTRLRGKTGFGEMGLNQGETVVAQFFIFDRQPSLDRLVPPQPETPFPIPTAVKSTKEAVDRVYWYALGRAPNAGEREVAEAALQGASKADGLAELLWAVMMTPEFQFIR